MPRRSTTTEPTRRTAVLPAARMTPEELEAVREKARAAGLTLSEYQRRACLSGRVVVRDTSVDVDAVRQLLAVGRNLNQLTKSGHINKTVDEAALRRTLARIEETVDRLLP